MHTTIKGIYENGIIKLLNNPLKQVGRIGVYVQIVKIPIAKKRKTYQAPCRIFDLEKFKKVADETFGAIPELPNGVKYENEMRKNSNWGRNYDW